MVGRNGDGPSPVGVLVVDTVGAIFARVRAAISDLALWRMPEPGKLPDLAGIGLIIYAAYEKPDWSVVAALASQRPTVVLTTQDDRDCARPAIAAGAFGCLSAVLSPAALRRTVGGALRGEPAFPRDVLGQLIREQGRRTPLVTNGIELTPRQREVAALIAKGAADKEIGVTLGITTATAQKHVSNVLKRLRVPNRAAAAATVTRYGLLPEPATVGFAPHVRQGLA